MIRRLLLAALAWCALAWPAAADFTFTQGTGATAFSFTASTGGTSLCAASVTHCWASVPINTAGAPLFITGNAGLVTGTGGTFPATQSGTWNITNISGTITLPTGAATATGLSTINTTLGSPFQAGGSIGNTTFASTQSGTWNIGTVTAVTSITNPVTVSTHAVTIAAGGVASGALASGSIAAGAMVDLLTMRQTVAAGTVASNSLLAGGIYNSTPITMTNGQGAALQVDANGFVKVNVTNSTTAVGNNADSVSATSGGNSPVVNYNAVWNGSTWDRLPGTTAGLKAVGQASTADIGNVGGRTNVTPTDCSGTITSGATAQNAHSAQSTLRGVTLANLDTTEVMWFSFTTTAAGGATQSYPLAPATATTFAGLSSYTTPMGFGYNTALSVIAATTGHKFSCTRW